VFGDAECADASAVRASWAQIKAAEKRDRGVLDGVPRRLPALHRARRVAEKAAGVGFDWTAPDQVLAKVEEEIAELKGALAAGHPERAAEELGDLLFAAVNLGRHLAVDPEAALHETTERFQDRFARIERALAARGRHPADATPEELEILWQEAKLAAADPAGDGAAQPGGLAQTEQPPDGEIDPGAPHHE
jgi:MazG family protein